MHNDNQFIQNNIFEQLPHQQNDLQHYFQNSHQHNLNILKNQHNKINNTMASINQLSQKLQTNRNQKAHNFYLPQTKTQRHKTSHKSKEKKSEILQPIIRHNKPVIVPNIISKISERQQNSEYLLNQQIQQQSQLLQKLNKPKKSRKIKYKQQLMLKQLEMENLQLQQRIQQHQFQQNNFNPQSNNNNLLQTIMMMQMIQNTQNQQHPNKFDNLRFMMMLNNMKNQPQSQMPMQNRGFNMPGQFNHFNPLMYGQKQESEEESSDEESDEETIDPNKLAEQQERERQEALALERAKQNAQKAVRHKKIAYKLLAAMTFIHQYKEVFKEGVKDKKQKLIQNHNDNINEMEKDVQNWLIPTLNGPLELMADIKKSKYDSINPGIKINKQDRPKRSENLRAIVKTFLDSLYDGFQEKKFTDQTLYFFGEISSNGNYLPDLYLFNFEIKKFKFSPYGAVKEAVSKHRAVVILITIFIRILIYKVIMKYHEINKSIKISDDYKQNILAVSSVLYELLMTHCRGYLATNQTNQNHLDNSDKIKCRTNDHLKITEMVDPKLVQEAMKNDEPLLVETYPRKLIQEGVFEDKVWLQEMLAMMTQIGENMATAADQIYEKGKQEIIDRGEINDRFGIDRLRLVVKQDKNLQNVIVEQQKKYQDLNGKN